MRSLPPRAPRLLLLVLPLLLLGASPDRGALPVRIDADRLEASPRQQQAVFSGRVSVAQAGWTLRCDRLVVHYGADRQVEQLVATGSVRVTEGARVVEARHAELDNRRRTLRLTGDPVLTQGDNVVRGEVVVLDLATRDLTVESVRARVRLGEVLEDAPGGEQ